MHVEEVPRCVLPSPRVAKLQLVLGLGQRDRKQPGGMSLGDGNGIFVPADLDDGDKPAAGRQRCLQENVGILHLRDRFLSCRHRDGLYGDYPRRERSHRPLLTLRLLLGLLGLGDLRALHRGAFPLPLVVRELMSSGALHSHLQLHGPGL